MDNNVIGGYMKTCMFLCFLEHESAKLHVYM